MSTAYKAKGNGLFFSTMTIVNWIDIFTYPKYRYIVVDSLNHCINEKGLTVHAWVIMSNHIHLITQATEKPLNSIFRDFKKFTCKEIIQAIKNGPESRREWLLNQFSFAASIHPKKHNYKVWQDGYHAKEIINRPFLFQKLNYIHQNPVRAQFVEDATHYIFSSARDYGEQQGLVKVVVLD